MNNASLFIGVFISTTTAVSIIAGVFRWKFNQIKSQVLSESTQSKEIIDNHKDINQLKEMFMKMQAQQAQQDDKILELIQSICDRISKMEGAWNQHNVERRNGAM